MTTYSNSDTFTFDNSSSSFIAKNPLLAPSDDLVSSIDEQYYLNSILDDTEDPFWDPTIWALCNDTTNDLLENSIMTSCPGEAAGAYGGTNGNNFDTTILGENIPMPSSVFPVPSLQYNCAFCQILREMTHTNGIIVKRLEIHGRFGVIMHAVLRIYDFDSTFRGKDTQMFDFRNEGMPMVKKFMVQYFEACKQEGYNLVEDPLSSFYEALCVGLNEPDDADDFLQPSPDNNADDRRNCRQEPSRDPEGETDQVGSTKIPLSMQRERTRNLRMKDFVQYSDLPIEYAARKMNLCPTVVKKICRKNGVERWPYRKIKSLRRKICKKRKMLESSGAEERAQALMDIKEHEEELAQLYAPFNN